MAAIVQFAMQNTVIIQHGFEQSDDVAHIQIGRKWVSVPVWFWMQWYGGGIRQLIDDYGLHKYRANPIEPAAIDNIELEARTMMRYYRKYGNQHYYTILGDIDRAVLKWEQRQVFERPSLKGQSKWEWIAERLSSYNGEFGWRQTKGLYEDAIDNLKLDQARRELRNFAKMIKLIQPLVTVEPASWQPFPNIDYANAA